MPARPSSRSRLRNGPGCARSGRRRRWRACEASSSSPAGPRSPDHLRTGLRRTITTPADLQLLVLLRQEIKQQAIVREPVDVVAPPLPADEAKSDALHPTQRRVVVHHPGVDRTKPVVAEGDADQLRGRDARIAPAVELSLAGNSPERCGLGYVVHIVQADDADGYVGPGKGVDPHQVLVALRHELEHRGRDALPPLPEVEPLVVRLPRNPP